MASLLSTTLHRCIKISLITKVNSSFFRSLFVYGDVVIKHFVMGWEFDCGNHVTTEHVAEGTEKSYCAHYLRPDLVNLFHLFSLLQKKGSYQIIQNLKGELRSEISLLHMEVLILIKAKSSFSLICAMLQLHAKIENQNIDDQGAAILD